MVLQFMARAGRPLSELVRGLPSYVMIKTKLPCPAEAVGEILREAKAALAGRPGARLNDADGLRADLEEGWVCVRASNTEPILRIIAEARTQPQAESLVQRVRHVVDGILGR
jgi:phosphomannomutase